jgi:hypothetical protein
VQTFVIQLLFLGSTRSGEKSGNSQRKLLRNDAAQACFADQASLFLAFT